MKCILAAMVALTLAVPAWGQDFDEGVQAYQRGDYATAQNEHRLLGGRTIAEWIVLEGYTGIGPALRVFWGRMPFIGSGAGMLDTLRTSIPLHMHLLVGGLQRNPRYNERQDLEEKLNLDPRLFDNRHAMLGRVVNAVMFLRGLENELINSVGNAKLSQEQRNIDKWNLIQIQSTIELLAPDIVFEIEPAKRTKALKDFLDNNPPGTPVIFADQDGNWALRWTAPKGKIALEGQD